MEAGVDDSVIAVSAVSALQQIESTLGPHSPQVPAFSPLPSVDVFRDEEDEDEDEDVGIEEEMEEEDLKQRQQRQQQGVGPIHFAPDATVAIPDGCGGVDEQGKAASSSLVEVPDKAPPCPLPFIDPTPHVSSQFYTFNRDSHGLMVQCILEKRTASPDEIRRVTPNTVLRSWRSVWKDRNEDTAFLTAWKRIQDKLNAHVDPAQGRSLLYFKSNPAQYVSYVEQWQEIVLSFHGDADLRHLGLKDTIDRIKQVWTVGAKFYGIPESFIRVCVASCSICTGTGHHPHGGSSGGNSGLRSKRRRFEYTESIDVPARDVPHRLQQLAAKHKVVLCIRQKYIRYKPFMAEVKDYACHRAGEPSSATTSKKSRVLKREPYASKRCGCGFRIRTIVPITNYNEKDKTFVYQEEGTAVFKMYAVHTGHEPGPSDGSARIIHRVVGHRGAYEQDMADYGVSDDMEPDPFDSLLAKDVANDLQLSVLRHVQELRAEVATLETKVMRMPQQHLPAMSQELQEIIHRIRGMGINDFVDKPQLMEHAMSLSDGGLGHWDDHQGHDDLYDKEVELIDDDESDFGHTLRDVVEPWDMMREDCQSGKMLISDSCKSDKWMLKDCEKFVERGVLDCEDEEDSKLIKPIRMDGSMITDPGLVGMVQVDGFYSDSAKWYDSPCGLDQAIDPRDGHFRHGGIG